MSPTPESSRPPSATADREIVLRRVFAAPRELVFDAWTDPRHVGAWFGPTGFTTTTIAMDVRPGGLWQYVMHGPDGTDYDNWIRYHRVERPALLVYDHGAALDEPAHFQVEVTFTEVDGGTELTMRSVFPTAAARDEVVQRYGAIEGGRQTLSRFDQHLAAQADAVAPVPRTYRFTRRFAAPRELVFQAWTDPRHLARWWGPRGFTNPVCRFDARPGGAIHIAMHAPDGTVHPMDGQVRQVRPPESLAFACQVQDGHGGIGLDVLNSVRFTAEADGTTTVDIEATAELVTTIGRQHLGGMEEGWALTLVRLDEVVEDLAAPIHAPFDIVSTRVIPASPERVWAAWTDPAQLARWWGPKGFRNTFAVFDLRPGGDWRFTMHGPDGTDYPNHSVFRRIEPVDLLVFEHLGTMHRFEVRASFRAQAGGTLVRFRMRFTSATECAAVRTFAVSANEENFDRLAALIAGG